MEVKSYPVLQELRFPNSAKATPEDTLNSCVVRKFLCPWLFLRGVFLLMLFLHPFNGHTQVKSTGTPIVLNYSRSVYNAGTQNWGISQDKHGFMYFANNDGILRFDGVNWDLIEVSHVSPVRSVFSDSENRIYAGLYNDFGILQYDHSGILYFQSLRDLLPDNTIGFDDIWKIHEIPRGIVFQSYDYLFLLRDNKIEVIKPASRFQFSFNVNGRLFLHEPGVGLYEYIQGNISKVPWADDLRESNIWTILEMKDNHLLIGTREDGIYRFENGRLGKWNTPVSELVENYKLFSATLIPGNHYAFGTILNGLVISDMDGNILQHINRGRGLQNNTVLSTFCDRDNNLWLGLDNGIDYVEVNSPLSFISDNEGLGTGYCCKVFGGELYLGTNQGLFVKTFTNFSDAQESFELIENTAGQVWSLEVFDDQLICGHNSGTFLIQNRKAVKISDEEGAWKYIRLKNNPDLLIGGHYTGLVLLQKKQNRWEFYKKVQGFNESSRFIFQENDHEFWISHGGKGIFRIQLTEDMDSVIHYRLYAENNGLPSSERNILFPFKGKFYVSAIDGIYAYHNSSDSFKIHNELNRLFSFDGQLLTLESDTQGNIWFIAENESGVFRQNEDMNYTKITAPFKQLNGKYVNGFEFIYPMSNDHVFFGLDNGFAHYSSKIVKSYTDRFHSYITKVEMPYLDSTVFCSPDNFETSLVVPFRKNEFRFHYAAPFYKNLETLQFSFMLENYSDGWSAWSSDRYRDFNNLPEGDYTFMVKAKNIYDIESEIAGFSFTITPPWHRSRTAYYTYLILFVFLTYFLVRYILYQVERSKRREKLKHETELRKREEEFKHQSLVSEKEIIRLRNEKLQSEMLHRDKELVNQTKNLIDKNKSLMQIKEEIQQLLRSTNDGQVKGRLASLNKKLIKEIDNKQQNKIFETYFDEVHEDFFKNLKNAFPDLSPREMRICAFIRMNLSSKEIAALLNITDRGVEISRYRLRQKLRLSRETHLSTFLSNF
jgi:ligand-binding sensor domain-containing protein/DNA-binding CsgD family transcriptional regulator